MYCIAPSGTDRAAVPCDTPGVLIVLDRVELAQYSPFYMDVESASAIGGALLLAWAVAYCFRMVIKLLKPESESEL